MSISPAAPFSGHQSGSYTSLHGGTGTFTRDVSTQNGSRVIDTSITNASGQTETRDVTRTKTATGFTRSVTTTLADGKTTTLNETATKQADGSYALAGTLVDASGQTETLSGTRQHAAAGNVTDLTFTNAAGQTRTQDATAVGTFDQLTRTTQGTTFGGVSFTNSSALAVLQSQAATS